MSAKLPTRGDLVVTCGHPTEARAVGFLWKLPEPYVGVSSAGERIESRFFVCCDPCFATHGEDAPRHPAGAPMVWYDGAEEPAS